MPKDVEEFLLKEYESAVRLTYHVDDLRAKVVAAFVALATAVATVATAAFDDSSWRTAGVVLLALAAIGAVVVLLTARLRSVQLEHFRIIDNVRRYFLGSDVALWNVVELSIETLPKEGAGDQDRKTGSYFWVLAIILSTGFLAGAGTYLMYDGACSLAAATSGLAVSISTGVLLDGAYFRRVAPRARPEYKQAP